MITKQLDKRTRLLEIAHESIRLYHEALKKARHAEFIKRRRLALLRASLSAIIAECPNPKSDYEFAVVRMAQLALDADNKLDGGSAE